MDNYNYPPGSDTASAPWNQPDAVVTDEDKENALEEVWALIEWGCDADISFSMLHDMIETVCPNEYFDDDFDKILEGMEIQHDDKGAPAMLTMMPQCRQVEIKHFAEVWADDRAEELANDNDNWLPW
jgi:hypothetical protein